MNGAPFTQLPANLPVPEDDGACAHLRGRHLPDLSLVSTSGHHVNLYQRPGLSVLYAYPLTGRPGVPGPPGWDEIPGARGNRQPLVFCNDFGRLASVGSFIRRFYRLAKFLGAFNSRARRDLSAPLFFEIASVLIRLDDVARFIVKANHSIM
jgi:hypothetical protein